MRYILAGLLLLTAACSTPKLKDEAYVEVCEATKQIRDVGTCEAGGRCRVRYDDSTYGIQYLPMEYMRVNVNCFLVRGKENIPEDKKGWIVIEGDEVWKR